MTQLYARAKRALGRRGGVLLVFGVMYAVLGVKAFVEPTLDDGRFVLYAMLPVAARALLWLIPAALALGSLILRKRVGDGAGFAALVLPAGTMAFSYVWSAVAHLFGITDWAFGWSSASIWLLILALILIVSGWGEVQAPAEREEVPSA
jgi:hypothetical protein